MDKNIFRCRDFSLNLGVRSCIMGILNVTYDSFSDGGKYIRAEDTIKRAVEMYKQGVDIIDIGGESTRPGFTEISAEEEVSRVIPVIKELKKNFNIPISIDTTKYAIAKEALFAGADIVNDVCGLQKDASIAELVSKFGAGIILMDNGRLRDDSVKNEVFSDVFESLKKSIEIAKAANVMKENIVIDPGIGFGKSFEENISILRDIKKLEKLDYPILLGVSRKSVIGEVLNVDIDNRLEGSIATAVYGILNGVSIVRVHDILETRRALDVIDRLKGEGE